MLDLTEQQFDFDAQNENNGLLCVAETVSQRSESWQNSCGWPRNLNKQMAARFNITET